METLVSITCFETYGADTDATRQDLVAAAFETLATDGYRGTTARSIAERANCNQAAIYYHFGGIDTLLLQALTESSQRRLDRYKEAITDVTDIGAVIDQLGDLYEEDRASKHLAVLTELLGGITADPGLREGIHQATLPWLEYVETVITEATGTLRVGAFLPAADLADLIFSLVVGVELRNKLDGDEQRPNRFFRLARLVAGIIQTA